MSLSPIATLCRLSGSTAVVTLNPAPPGYDPDAAEDQGPATPTTTDLRGVFSKVAIAGIEVKHSALFLVAAVETPADLKSDVSHCLVGGIDYTVREIDPRWYLGQHDGFTLHLGL